MYSNGLLIPCGRKDNRTQVASELFQAERGTGRGVWARARPRDWVAGRRPCSLGATSPRGERCVLLASWTDWPEPCHSTKTDLGPHKLRRVVGCQAGDLRNGRAGAPGLEAAGSHGAKSAEPGRGPPKRSSGTCPLTPHQWQKWSLSSQPLGVPTPPPGSVWSPCWLSLGRRPHLREEGVQVPACLSDRCPL